MSIERSDRIYQAEDQLWYFSVRGNVAKGPFSSWQEAESALRRHIRDCRRRTDMTAIWPESWPALRLRRRDTHEPSHG